MTACCEADFTAPLPQQAAWDPLSLMLQGEWGDYIKWMFVPTAKDNRLLPSPVLMKQTLDGECHSLVDPLPTAA